MRFQRFSLIDRAIQLAVPRDRTRPNPGGVLPPSIIPRIEGGGGMTLPSEDKLEDWERTFEEEKDVCRVESTPEMRSRCWSRANERNAMCLLGNKK